MSGWLQIWLLLSLVVCGALIYWLFWGEEL